MAVGSVVSTIVKYSGLILFLFGIFTLSNKYPQLKSSKIIIPFILAMIMDLVLAIFFYTYPLLNVGDNISSLSEFYLKVPEQYSFYLFFALIFFIVIGILILVASYYLVKWSNFGLSTFNRTKVFLYYGIIFIIGQIIIGISLFQTGIAFEKIERRTFILSTDVNSIHSALIIVNLGFLILLLALIVEIVACFILYFRIQHLEN